MLRNSTSPAGISIMAAACFLCVLTAAPWPLHAQPMVLPGDVPTDDGSIGFEERFSADHRAQPIFTRPETQSLLATLPPWAAINESAELAEAADETRQAVRIPFAEIKGPAKILNDLIVSKAEAEPAGPPREAGVTQEESAAQEGAVQNLAAVPHREPDPLAERPPPEASAPPLRQGPDQTGQIPLEQNGGAAREQAAPRQDQSSQHQDLAAILTAPAEPPSPQATTRQDTIQTPHPVPDQSAKAAHKDVGEKPGASAPDHRRAEKNAGMRLIGRGRATWYQHPGRTASGEVYDPDQLTAAHHTLPFDTWLRVVNVQTGQSVFVRINDRIPRTTRLIVIDLSRGSAKALGITGIAQVSLHQDVGQDTPEARNSLPAANRSFVAALGMAISRSLERAQLENALRDSLRQRAMTDIASASSTEQSRLVESALRDLLRQRAARL